MSRHALYAAVLSYAHHAPARLASVAIAVCMHSIGSHDIQFPCHPWDECFLGLRSCGDSISRVLGLHSLGLSGPLVVDRPERGSFWDPSLCMQVQERTNGKFDHPTSLNINVYP